MPAYEIKNHILFKDGAAVARPKEWSPNRTGVIKPEGLILHWTAGFGAQNAVNWLCDPRAGASAQFVIDRDGTVWQVTPANAKAWHAGVSSYKGRSMCNGFTVGIEFVNCGPVIRRGDGKFVAEVSQTKVLDPKDVGEGHHPNGEKTIYWQVYPEAQIEAGLGVAAALKAAYGISFVTGHYDIAPKRKRDPGPLMPYDRFRAVVESRK